MNIRGRQGEVRWGYLTAGSVGPWRLARDDRGVLLTASVTAVDVFRISQRPLTFVVPRESIAWRWPVTELQIQDGALTARLGPLEK